MKTLVMASAFFVAGTALSNAVVLTLPESKSLPQHSSRMGTSVEAVIATVKTLDAGAYAGGNNNNNITNWGTNSEGVWTNTDNVGTITLCGRSGVSGDSFALVLTSGLTAGEKYESFTFSAAGSAGASLSGSVDLGLAVVDSSGNYVLDSSPATGTLSVASTDPTSVTVSFGDGLTWEDGYRVVAVVHGFAGSPTTAYSITGISVSAAEAVPEPSAFGLLAGAGALALVAARRRRNKR